MKSLKNRTTVPVALGLFAGIGAGAFQGCALAEKCGLGCPDEGIAEGNASITGIASLDAFFSAVLDLKNASAKVDAEVRAQLDAMALSVDLQAGAGSAEIAAAVKAKINAHVDGGLKINYKPAECSASVEVAANAAAECDAEVDPGSVEVKCEGSCQAEAGAMVDCGAMAELKCVGTAPSFMCEGSCTGECELTTAAACEGTCRGQCNPAPSCTVMDSQGNCAGECMGDCQGTCELKAGGTCSGDCRGSCEWTPPGGMCDANVEAKCEAMAGASVQCEGKCEGSAEPPEVSAECEATVEAKAEASVECTPPSLEVTWQWNGSATAEQQAEFKAWLEGFKAQFAALIAASAKAEILIQALGTVGEAGVAAVEDFAGSLESDPDLFLSIKAGCAVAELDAAGEVVASSTASVEGTVTAFADISGAIGG